MTSYYQAYNIPGLSLFNTKREASKHGNFAPDEQFNWTSLHSSKESKAASSPWRPLWRTDAKSQVSYYSGSSERPKKQKRSVAKRREERRGNYLFDCRRTFETNYKLRWLNLSRIICSHWDQISNVGWQRDLGKDPLKYDPVLSNLDANRFCKKRRMTVLSKAPIRNMNFRVVCYLLGAF